MNALRNLQEQLGACLDARLAANRLKALGQPTPAVRELARQLDTEARRAWRALPGVLHRFERNGWPRLKAAVPKPKGPKT